MSTVCEEHVETITHSEPIGLGCDGCGRVHRYDLPPPAERSASYSLRPTPKDWMNCRERTYGMSSKDLCPDCWTRVEAFIKELRP